MFKIYLDEQGRVHFYEYVVQQGDDCIPAKTLSRAQAIQSRNGGEIIPLDKPTAKQQEIIAARNGFTQTDNAHIFVASVMNGWNGLTVEQQLMLTQLKQQQTIDALIMAQLGGIENV